jgi:hypothetical protein
MLMVDDFAHHDWSSIPVTQHPGETGTPFQQALNAGPFRIRKMRYSNGWMSDGDGPHRMYSKYGAELHIVVEEL